jgi:NADP-dependent 3-hydroxy acid dehydrogenase YdfG
MKGNLEYLTSSNPELVPYFYNKVVVITGGTSELGHALSYWYLNHGAKVAMVGRN